MSKLPATQRNAMPQSEFALPDGRYPVNDAGHARNALSRVAQNGSPAEKAVVRAKVRSKFPDITQSSPYAMKIAQAAKGKK